MLNKFLIFYASLMLTMCLVIMFLLISVELTNISELKHKSLAYNSEWVTNCDVISGCENNTSPVNDNIEKYSEGKLIINTDKKIYSNQDPINITFINQAKSKMVQNTDSSIEVKTRFNIGKNFEVAFIEYKEGEEWIAIEPVKRCSDNCSNPCTSTTQIPASAEESFVWTQEIILCEEGVQKSTMAPTGEYRISSAAWDEESGTHKKVNSEIFKISSISKK